MECCRKERTVRICRRYHPRPTKYIPVKKKKETGKPKKPDRYLVCDQELRAEEARHIQKKETN